MIDRLQILTKNFIIMKIYVYAEAYAPKEEYADIVQTKVFTNKDEAVAYLKKQVAAYNEYSGDLNLWQTIYREDNFCNMINDGTKGEVVMAIEEHEI